MDAFTNLANSIDRAQRLKSAKADAAKEIEAYKAQKDKELKDFETKVSNKLCELTLARRFNKWIMNTNLSTFLF